jgi:hypothetical protein
MINPPTEEMSWAEFFYHSQRSGSTGSVRSPSQLWQMT